MDRRTPPRADLDLLPMMNLVSLLIPLLLMGTQLVALSTIRVTQPMVAPTPGLPTEQLALVVRIEPEGFYVEGAADVLGEEVFAVPCVGRCASTSDWPVGELLEALVAVKAAHPSARSVTVVPDARVTYQVIVRTLDATRSHQVDGRPQALFPEASIHSR